MSVDALDDRLRADILAAKKQILQTAATRPSWTAFDLKKHARRRQSAATMGLALYALVDEGRIVRGPDYRVRLSDRSAQQSESAQVGQSDV